MRATLFLLLPCLALPLQAQTSPRRGRPAAAPAAAPQKSIPTKKDLPVKAPPAKAAAKSAPAYPKPPLDVYPGSRYLADETEQHREDSGGEKAWVFGSKTAFPKLAEFYAKQVRDDLVAESEGPTLYFAITKGFEVKVEKGEGAENLVFIALKPLPDAPPPAAGEREQEPMDEGPPDGDDSIPGDRPSTFQQEGEDSPQPLAPPSGGGSGGPRVPPPPSGY